MQKLALFIILIGAIIGGYFLFRQPTKEDKTPAKQSVSSVSTDNTVSPQETYLFVPFWTLDPDISESSDKLIYFGVTAGKEGIDEDNDDYKNIEEFVSYSNNKPTALTVRMLNSDTNNTVLRDTKIQEKIIQESISIAKKYGFSQVILDLETQGLPFQALVNQISAFNALFAKELHEEHLTFGTLLFGDNFYRVRPYDAREIGKAADRVYIMAYDLSKSKGDPGPNFPLDGKDIYGYDFTTMTSDFLQVIPKSKLTIIVGMFGYDWKTNDKERGIGSAQSKTTLQMERFLTRCIAENTCKEKSDTSTGTKITYLDEDENHVIWYETSESVQKKIEYLDSIGVYSVGYWAYSYF